MKLTKQQESEALNVYHLFWNSYVSGDPETFASTLDDAFEMIGTSETEVAHNKAEGIAFYKAQMDEIVGKAEMRNRSISAKPLNGMFLINENCDIYVIGEPEWTFYSKIRISTLLHETESGWKVIQQHGSLPDMRVQEGETLAMDKITKENLELRDAVKRRTADLHAKNRELEIEAALERVRARTMAMQHSDELQDAAVLMFDQIDSLGIQIMGCGFNIWEDDRKAATAWMSGLDRMQPPFKTSSSEDIFLRIYEASQNGERLFVEGQAGEELEAHYKYMASIPVFKKILDQLSEKGLSAPSYQIMHCAYFSHGYLMFITLEPVPDAHDIFTRFANVFEQTYTRFLDLKNAEAQARESEIQLTLERVRARTMAMQHSDELTEASEVLDQQVRALGIETWGCAFHIYADDPEDDYEWFSSREGTLPFYKTPREKFFLTFYEKGQAGETFHVEEFLGEDCKAHYDYLMTQPVIGDALQEIVDAGGSLPDSQYDHVAFFKYGYVLFITYEPVPEAHEVFKRFANVFEQTYTRFLDLQKAEAQARDAQINLAVERVRAKALAMFKSEEILQVVNTLKNEIMGLDIPNVSAATIHLREPDGRYRIWDLTSIEDDENGIEISLDVTYKLEDTHPEFFMREVWEKTDDYFVVIQDLGRTPHTIDWLRKNGHPDYANEFAAFLEESGLEKAYHPTVPLQNGRMSVDLLAEPTPEIEIILKKMASAFDLAYKRFEDLKKAEAQSREAQIELALERIRARTMAMQNSEELADVAFVLFEQLRGLGGNLWGTGFGLCKNNSEKDSFWFANENGVFPPVSIPNTTDPAHKQMFKGWKADKGFLAIEASGKELKNHYDYMISLPEVRPFFQKILDEGLSFPEWQQWNAAYFKHGYLLIITLEPYPDHDILVRFAKVFEQTYTRFLDLQKAEEQAREAKIEVALEKVRSRTMGMQKGEELQEVAVLLYKELIALGVTNFVTCGYVEIHEKLNRQYTWVTAPGGDTLGLFYLPLTGDTTFDERYAAWKRQQLIFHQTVDGEERSNHLEYAITTFNSKEAEEMVRSQFPDPTVFYCFNFSHGYLHIVTGSLLKEEEEFLLARFTKVFEQTYTRFLDLEKVEKQAREAQIEAALERVRSRTMAMQHSEELSETSAEMFRQIQELGLEQWSCGFNIFDHENNTITQWVSSGDGRMITPFETPSNEDVFDTITEAFKKDKSFISIEMSGEDLAAHYEYLSSLPVVGEEIAALKEAGIEVPDHQVLNIAFFKHGYLLFITFEQVPEYHQIYKRFADVFKQTYTRFLDLKKAEKQARESQIEAALERVRSRSMGMQKSSDLRSVVDTMYGEFKGLGLIFHAVVIQLLLDDTKDMYMWINSGDGSYDNIIHWPYVDIPMFNAFYEARTGNKTFDYRTGSEAETREFFEEYFKLEGVPEERKDALKNVSLIDNIGTYQKHTGVFLMRYTEGEYSEKDKEIVRRFSKVFEQTYTRFLDLQKAEEQAREAQIETALERVRARSMGMQKSEELLEVVRQIGQELKEMGIEVNYSQIWTDFSTDPDDGLNLWVDVHGQSYLEKFHIPYVDHPITSEFYEALDKNLNFFSDRYSKSEKDQFFRFLFKNSDLKSIAQERKDLALNAPGWIRFTVILNNSCLHFGRYNLNEFAEEEKEIFIRLGKVFGQAYTRFLDLQTAENQAREAQIGNALEKVRSRSLAMQSPDELIEVAQLLREEMGALGVEELETSSIFILDDSSGKTQCWFTIKDADNPVKSVSDRITINLQDTWVGRQMDKFYSSGQDITSVLTKGDHRIEWFRYVEQNSDLLEKSEFFEGTIPERIIHLCKFSNGFLGAASPGDISDESWDLMKRATGVFSFAYTRFRDLQKAEESARRARQQASLDRVRADISSMRSAEDLNRVTPLIWNELTTLGIPFIRCGVFIVHEEEQEVEVYLSKPDGTSLAVMHLPFDSNELVTQTVESWRNKEVYTQYWTKEEFLDWGRSMMEQNQVLDMKTYQGAEEAPESLNLHFIPFNQGMLYVGSTESLSDEEIGLAESLAEAFSIAYARYEDFVKLEKAKASIEDALSELKATQSQLVQQEKLASLGQLTAGIAHEIKNPLNFVNNFSEVSLELIDEARDEVKNSPLLRGAGGVSVEAKSGEHSQSKDVTLDTANTPLNPLSRGEAGSSPEVTLILDIFNDIEANLKKIHKHGTRADGIVKSMLQHSRGGDGVMEPTPLNPLIKEYVNLAFHGMRAGKEPINVDIELDLDESVGEVDLIAEDFSRVILNVCNNAFDAMKEKLSAVSDQLSASYKPKLTIQTHRKNDTVTIEIEDNGPGIPDEIKDKILQPFFTTKKGTAGTGLGLSITNDIIKAHGGNLEVYSENNAGSRFVIQLSIKR